MNKKLLIPIVLLSVFLLSAETPKREIEPLLKEVRKVNHDIERKAIEARCYANETSKTTQEFFVFTDTLPRKDLVKLVKLIE